MNQHSVDTLPNTWHQHLNVKWTVLLFGVYLHLITLRAFKQFMSALAPNATVGLRPNARLMSSGWRWSKRVSFGCGLVQIWLHSPRDPAVEAEQTAHCAENPMLHMTKSQCRNTAWTRNISQDTYLCQWRQKTMITSWAGKTKHMNQILECSCLENSQC